jgi:hypothetical protein
MIPSVVVIGVPDSGKSSFIAALSHILEFKEIETALTLARLPDEAKYLHEMRSEWEGCQPFERTKAGVHPITFNLVDSEGSRIDLSFPDIAGEEFDRQWSSRIWNTDFLEAIEHATSVLLFLNVKTFRKPFSKADEAALQGAALELEEDIDGEVPAEQPSPSEVVDPGAAIAKLVSSQTSENTATEVKDPTLWKPEDADEQAKLVDILQALADFVPDRRWRLGIVISAWEIIHNSKRKVTPRAWLKNVQLLHQYLESNPESFDVGVFGVSAQGGDPEKEAQKLQQIETPSLRVLVVADKYEGHDLTRVISWAMSGDA